MRPYSQDLRERVIEALEARDGSQAEIAERFVVSLPFVEKLWWRWRTTGSCAPQPHGGGRRRSLRGAEGLIRTALAQEPDLTLASLCERVAQAGHPQVSTKPCVLSLNGCACRSKKVTPCQRARHAAGEASARGLSPPAPGLCCGTAEVYRRKRYELGLDPALRSRCPWRAGGGQRAPELRRKHLIAGGPGG